MQSQKPRPSRALKQLNAKHGSTLWGLVNDALRMKMTGKIEWPDWCFIPMGGWMAMLYSNEAIPSIAHTFEMAKVAAIGTWRYTQGIYRFEPEFFDALENTEPSGDLPSEVLFRLPEYCVYVEIPRAGPLKGFFAHLEYDYNTGRPELRFWVDDDRGQFPFVMHIGDWSIEEAIRRANDEALSRFDNAGSAAAAKAAIEEHMGQTTRMFRLFTSMLLYLSSDAPEIEPIERELPARPKPQRTKNGMILQPPNSPRVWTVGSESAKAIRKWEKVPTGERHESPRPHIRRAHWHGFWKGPKSGMRSFFYKWIPPIPVNLNK